MSDHDKVQVSRNKSSIIEDLHKSDKGLTTEIAQFNDSILRHSAPALLGQSRFVLFKSADKLRISMEKPQHPRRNLGRPHLVES